MPLDVLHAYKENLTRKTEEQVNRRDRGGAGVIDQSMSDLERAAEVRESDGGDYLGGRTRL